MQERNSLNVINMENVIFRGQIFTVEINSTQGRNLTHTTGIVSVLIGIAMVTVTHEAIWKEAPSGCCGSYTATNNF